MTSAQDSVWVKKPAGACGRVLYNQPASQSLGGPLLLPARRDPCQSWLAWTGLNLLSSSPKATKRTRIAFTVKSCSLVRHFLPPPTPPTNTTSHPNPDPTTPPSPLVPAPQQETSTTAKTQPRIVGQDVDYQLVYVALLPPFPQPTRGGQLADMKVLLSSPCSLRRPLVARPAQQARQAAVPRPRQCRKDDAAAHAEGASHHTTATHRPNGPSKTSDGSGWIPRSELHLPPCRVSHGSIVYPGR